MSHLAICRAYVRIFEVGLITSVYFTFFNLHVTREKNKFEIHFYERVLLRFFPGAHKRWETVRPKRNACVKKKLQDCCFFFSPVQRDNRGIFSVRLARTTL